MAAANSKAEHGVSPPYPLLCAPHWLARFLFSGSLKILFLIALQAEKENQPTEILTLFILKYIADTAIEMIESVHLSNRVRNRPAAP